MPRPEDLQDELGAYAQPSPWESYKGWVLGSQSPLRVANMPAIPGQIAQAGVDLAKDTVQSLSPIQDGKLAVPPIAANAWDSMKGIGTRNPTTQDFFNLAPLIFGGAGAALDSEAGGLMANRPVRWPKDVRTQLDSMGDLSHVDAAKALSEQTGIPYSAENVRYQRNNAGLTSPMGSFDDLTQGMFRKLYGEGKNAGDIAKAVSSETGRAVDRKSVNNWLSYQKKNGLLSNADKNTGGALSVFQYAKQQLERPDLSQKSRAAWEATLGKFMPEEGDLFDYANTKPKTGPLLSNGDKKLGAFSAPSTLADHSLKLKKQPGGSPYETMFHVTGDDGNVLMKVRIGEDGSNIFVNNISAHDGANAIGPAAVRALLRELHAHYPDATSVGGVRVTGARRAAEISRGGEDYWDNDANAPEVRIPLRKRGAFGNDSD